MSCILRLPKYLKHGEEDGGGVAEAAEAGLHALRVARGPHQEQNPLLVHPEYFRYSGGGTGPSPHPSYKREYFRYSGGSVKSIPFDILTPFCPIFGCSNTNL